jgi:hypothetical protein
MACFFIKSVKFLRILRHLQPLPRKIETRRTNGFIGSKYRHALALYGPLSAFIRLVAHHPPNERTGPLFPQLTGRRGLGGGWVKRPDDKDCVKADDLRREAQ